MRKLISMFSILMFISFFSTAQDKVYVCPMHPEETSASADAKCGKCGMALEPKEKVKANEPKAMKKLPSVKVTDLKGNNVDASTLYNDGKPFAVMFWATWCGPCIKELTNTAELYGDWQKKTGVKIYAVSVDDSRASNKVQALVEGKRWEYDILLDKNQDLMRALGIQMPPTTYLLNGNAEVVWVHPAYIEGDEFELGERIEALVK